MQSQSRQPAPTYCGSDIDPGAPKPRAPSLGLKALPPVSPQDFQLVVLGGSGTTRAEFCLPPLPGGLMNLSAWFPLPLPAPAWHTDTGVQPLAPSCPAPPRRQGISLLPQPLQSAACAVGGAACAAGTSGSTRSLHQEEAAQGSCRPHALPAAVAPPSLLIPKGREPPPLQPFV